MTFQTQGDAQAWLAHERLLISQQEWASPKVRAERTAAAEAQRRWCGLRFGEATELRRKDLDLTNAVIHV